MSCFTFYNDIHHIPHSRLPQRLLHLSELASSTPSYAPIMRFGSDCPICADLQNRYSPTANQRLFWTRNSPLKTLNVGKNTGYFMVAGCTGVSFEFSRPLGDLSIGRGELSSDVECCKTKKTEKTQILSHLTRPRPQNALQISTPQTTKSGRGEEQLLRFFAPRNKYSKKEKIISLRALPF